MTAYDPVLQKHQAALSAAMRAHEDAQEELRNQTNSAAQAARKGLSRPADALAARAELQRRTQALGALRATCEDGAEFARVVRSSRISSAAAMEQLAGWVQDRNQVAEESAAIADQVGAALAEGAAPPAGSAPPPASALSR